MMTQNSFEILSHADDVRMRVWGKTIKDLFCNALDGVASYLKPEIFVLVKKKGAAVKQKIKVEAVDLNSLLVEFLSGVIAHADAHGTIFTSVTFKKFGENFLEGVINGVKIDEFDQDIKAVSYREVNVAKNPKSGFYETILVFDV